jgi:hypothetical protein
VCSFGETRLLDFAPPSNLVERILLSPPSVSTKVKS